MNQSGTPQKNHTPAGQSWAERNGFSDWALATLWIITALVLFQLTAGLVSLLLLLATGALEPGSDFMASISDHLELLFIGNSVGQILFLGLATWKVAELHVSKQGKKDFMRARYHGTTPAMTLWALLLFAVVQPAVWYLGYLNSMLPMPESFLEVQQAQHEMIENFLRSDGVLWLALFNIAIVPAFCEEVMFRGYVQGALEKSWGIGTAIVISGILFGLFHMQLGNLLPLATLGILLAVITWLSGSLIPAIGAHFINNGSAVLIAVYLPELAFAEMSPDTAPPLWALILSLFFSVMIIRSMVQLAGGLGDTDYE